MQYSVVIPIYKEQPNEMEKISFDQCLHILNKYHISIVAPDGLNTSFYENLLKRNKISYSIERFDINYFKNITGYNFLLLSKEFYLRFNKYDYILIYQLDCFVFRDDLDYWAKKGFDYIGSPWFAHYMSHTDDRPFWYNGNGGFSLRRVDAFLKVLDWKLPLRKMPQIVYDLRDSEMSSVKKKVLTILTFLGYHNGIKSFMKKQKYAPETLLTALYDDEKRGNEDTIWSNLFKDTRISIKTPNFEDGLGFSFEQSPDYLFIQNNQELPFGCHAWWKYDLNFWRPHIENFGHKIPNTIVI